MTNSPCTLPGLELDALGSITLIGKSGSRLTAFDTEVARGGVEMYCHDSWAYLVGAEGTSLWFANAIGPRLEQVATIARLDMSGGYDPGGMQRTIFHGIAESPELVLFEYESGLAMLESVGRVRWRWDHHDLTLHVTAIDNGAVWLVGEGGTLARAVDDGAELR